MVRTQFKESLGILTEKELNTLSKQRVLIVGCGGIGGNVANQLVRLGLKNLTLVDFDTFDKSNLNRQLFSNHKVLKKFKANVVKEELQHINPSINISSYTTDVQSLDEMVYKKHDCIIDCVDSPRTKVFLNTLSSALKLPLLHGSCAGWYSQIGWIEPGCSLLEELYMDHDHGLEKELKNPPFTPSVTASYMVSEFVKYFTNKEEAVINQLLLIDTKNNTLTLTRGNQ